MITPTFSLPPDFLETLESKLGIPLSHAGTYVTRWMPVDGYLGLAAGHAERGAVCLVETPDGANLIYVNLNTQASPLWCRVGTYKRKEGNDAV
jgi:hypothetical protein